jgi:hypothetical protein
MLSSTLRILLGYFDGDCFYLAVFPNSFLAAKRKFNYSHKLKEVLLFAAHARLFAAAKRRLSAKHMMTIDPNYSRLYAVCDGKCFVDIFGKDRSCQCVV